MINWFQIRYRFVMINLSVTKLIIFYLYLSEACPLDQLLRTIQFIVLNACSLHRVFWLNK